MTLASWFSSLRRSRRRLTRTGARRNRSRAFHRRASFDALEGRALLSTVSFGTDGESVNESAGTFSILVTVTGTPTVTTFATGLRSTVGMAVDGSNLFVSNSGNGIVSEVTPTGVVISTPFVSGLHDPNDLAFDAAGNLFIADDSNDTVTKVTPAGPPSTFAVGLTGPFGLAFDTAGNLYVANRDNNTVSKVTPAGNVSIIASGFEGPEGLAFDSAGNLFVTNVGTGTVSEVTPAGSVSTFASGFNEPVSLAFDTAGNLYVANINGDTVSEVTPAGNVSIIASGFNAPDALAFDAGNLFVANSGDDTISEVSDTATVPFTLGGSAVAGVDFSGVTASPLTFGIGQTTQDITGTLLSDPGPNQTLTFTLGTPTGDAVLGNPSANTLTISETAPEVQFSIGSETVNVSAGTFSIPVTVTGTPTVTTFASGFEGPEGLAFDAGNLFTSISNSGNGAVKEVTSAGVVSASDFASGLDDPSDLAFDSAGNLYVANVGTNTVSEVTPAGNVSTFASGFNVPEGLAFDSAGNLYVANINGDTVSKVTPAGLVSTFATGFSEPDALAFDSAGNLFVTNAGNNTVSEVTRAGNVSTFAIGFNEPAGVAFDSAGNLYVANTNSNTVSEVTPAGVVSTFAAGFNGPEGLAFNAGNLFVGNAGNNTISEVTETVVVPFTLGGSAVAGVDFSGVTTGPLTFGIGKTTQFITGTLLSDPGTNRALTLTLGTPTGGAVLGNPSVNTLTITETSATTSVPPVFIGEQRVFAHRGKHKKLLGFEFLFNSALNPGGAQSTRNYLVAQKHGKKFKVLPVESASYNPANFSATISVGGFNAGKAGQVIITGLAGANGAAIPQITSGL
jgi:sugar lactone lactonase YvrE